MKIKTILTLTLGCLFFFSCSSRDDDIPAIINAVETAINNNDSAALKAYVSTSANDYILLENGTFDWSQVVSDGRYSYDFSPNEDDIPSKGDTIHVHVATTVYDNTNSNFLYSSADGQETRFAFTDEGSGLNEDWKILEIYLPATSGQEQFLNKINP